MRDALSHAYSALLMAQRDEELPYRDEWYRLVPAVHRWLNGHENQRFAGDHDYWFAAYYILRALLGWTDCGAGLQRLRDLATDDPRARLLRHRWPALDGMALWIWTTGMGSADVAPRDASTFGDVARVQRAEALMVGSGFTGGYDPHHLHSHLAVVEDAFRAAARPVGRDAVVRDGRRAVLFVDRLDEWPMGLNDLGTTLPHDEPPSWHVHIVARQDGYLGTFRRCWECRRWFQGKAEIHRLGHRTEIGHGPG